MGHNFLTVIVTLSVYHKLTATLQKSAAQELLKQLIATDITRSWSEYILQTIDSCDPRLILPWLIN
jgi:hypothetical protein